MLLLWITNHEWIYAFLFIYCANSISTKILPLKFCHSVSKSLSCLFRLDQVCSIKNELKNAIFLLTSPTTLSWRMCCLFWPANRFIACCLLVESILFSFLTSFFCCKQMKAQKEKNVKVGCCDPSEGQKPNTKINWLRFWLFERTDT